MVCVVCVVYMVCVRVVVVVVKKRINFIACNDGVLSLAFSLLTKFRFGQQSLLADGLYNSIYYKI